MNSDKNAFYSVFIQYVLFLKVFSFPEIFHTIIIQGYIVFRKPNIAPHSHQNDLLLKRFLSFRYNDISYFCCSRVMQKAIRKVFQAKSNANNPNKKSNAISKVPVVITSNEAIPNIKRVMVKHWNMLRKMKKLAKYLPKNYSLHTEEIKIFSKLKCFQSPKHDCQHSQYL